MKCCDCPYYTSGYMWNQCSLLEQEYFYEVDDCNAVRNDGTPFPVDDYGVPINGKEEVHK